VEFGVPYEVPQKLVTTYLSSKKEAISQLLTQIEKVRFLFVCWKSDFLKS